MSSSVIDYVVYCRKFGMEFFANEVRRGLRAASLETAELTGNGFRVVGHGPAKSR
jgi:hypothetical protein